jgi:hypothetical protein
MVSKVRPYLFHTAVCKIMTVFVIQHAGCPRISSVHSQLSALSLTHTVHVGILHIWAPFSTWTMGVQNSFKIIENCSAMCILCIAEHMYLVLKISIRAYGISRLKLGVVWMLLHNYTIKSIAGCRKFRFFGEESECWFHPDTQTSKVYQGAMGGMHVLEGLAFENVCSFLPIVIL